MQENQIEALAAEAERLLREGLDGERVPMDAGFWRERCRVLAEAVAARTGAPCR